VLEEGFTDSGVSWKDDVKPVLGPELVVVVPGDNTPVALMQPTDKAAFRKLLEESDDSPAVVDEAGDWVVVADSQEQIDAYRAALGSDTLADDAGFRTAMLGLPGDAMARAWVNGANLTDTVRELAASSGGSDQLAFESMSMAIVPEEAGVFLSVSVKTPNANGTSYEPKLLERVPASAVAALSFGGTEKALDSVRDSLDLDEMSEALEEGLGLSLDRVIGLFSGEGMLYLREGAAIPEVTLALAPPDVDGAYADVETLMQKLAEGMDSEIKTVEQDGLEVRRIDQGDVNVSWAKVDDAVIVTTGASGIRLFREDGDKLAGFDAFKAAADRVGLGETTGGFFYVDIDGLIPLVERLADTADQTLPDQVRETMEAFDSVILVGEVGEDGTTTMSGRLRMNER